MRRALVLGLAAALAGGVALAQSSQPPAGEPESRAMRVPQAPFDGPHRGPPHGPPGPFGPRPPMSRNPSVDLERGDVRISVRCAETESVKACVDALTPVLDRLFPAR